MRNNAGLLGFIAICFGILIALLIIFPNARNYAVNSVKALSLFSKEKSSDEDPKKEEKDFSSFLGYEEKKQNTDYSEISLTYPKKITQIPELNKELEKKFQDMIFLASEKEKNIKTNSFKSHEPKWSFSFEVKEIFENSVFLVFEGWKYQNTGGAHGSSWFENIIWDKEQKKILSLSDIVTSQDTFYFLTKNFITEEVLRQKKEKGSDNKVLKEDDEIKKNFLKTEDFQSWIFVQSEEDIEKISGIEFIFSISQIESNSENEYRVFVPVDIFESAISSKYEKFFIKKPLSAPSQNSLSLSCEDEGGKWISGFYECEIGDSLWCEKNNGEFFECESSCRNDFEAKICTMQCIQVCKF